MYCKKILPLIIAIMAIPFLANAQVTTSSITGIVKNKSGSTLAGATITALHVPTGSVYTAVSRTEGRFDISNMNPGGPYTITASFVGYETNKKEDIFLSIFCVFFLFNNSEAIIIKVLFSLISSLQ